MGLIVNKPAPELSFADLLAQLKIPPRSTSSSTRVYFGGPVEHGRGFVLHTTDYSVSESSLRVGADFAMTATVDILQDMARGAGPAPGAARPRLCRLGTGPARGGDPGERLAGGAGRRRHRLRAARRRQVGRGPALDLDRPPPALRRGRPRLIGASSARRARACPCAWSRRAPRAPSRSSTISISFDAPLRSLFSISPRLAASAAPAAFCCAFDLAGMIGLLSVGASLPSTARGARRFDAAVPICRRRRPCEVGGNRGGLPPRSAPGMAEDADGPRDLSRQARLRPHRRAGRQRPPRLRRRLRRPEARRPPAALRLPPRDRRRARELGGDQGPEPRARREAPRGPRRGPPARLRRLRGHDRQGRLRRRRGHRLGPRPLGSPRATPPPACARAGSTSPSRARSSRAAGTSCAWAGRAARSARTGCSSRARTTRRADAGRSRHPRRGAGVGDLRPHDRGHRRRARRRGKAAPRAEGGAREAGRRRRLPGLRPAGARDAEAEAARGRRLGPRDQVRRLPHRGAGPRRHGRSSSPGAGRTGPTASARRSRRRSPASARRRRSSTARSSSRARPAPPTSPPSRPTSPPGGPTASATTSSTSSTRTAPTSASCRSTSARPASPRWSRGRPTSCASARTSPRTARRCSTTPAASASRASSRSAATAPIPPGAAARGSSRSARTGRSS